MVLCIIPLNHLFIFSHCFILLTFMSLLFFLVLVSSLLLVLILFLLNDFNMIKLILWLWDDIRINIWRLLFSLIRIFSHKQFAFLFLCKWSVSLHRVFFSHKQSPVLVSLGFESLDFSLILLWLCKPVLFALFKTGCFNLVIIIKTHNLSLGWLKLCFEEFLLEVTLSTV